jgi:hypothetical protein
MPVSLSGVARRPTVPSKHLERNKGETFLLHRLSVSWSLSLLGEDALSNRCMERLE